MGWWVITANGTASGPMEADAAWTERERLIRKSGGCPDIAAHIAVVKAETKEQALEYKPPMI